MTESEETLAYALLWARNHIDLNLMHRQKAEIVKRLDAVLEVFPPTMAGGAEFRRRWPQENYLDVPNSKQVT